ncbi:unnamed protein product [Rotaria magnacalcarata]
MIRLSGLFYVVLTVALFYSISANVVIYTVTFDRCIHNSTCPQGNPTKFNSTFTLNATTVVIHPLTICKNSPVPKFCQGVRGKDELNKPITKAGETTFVTFTTIGSYYYGCLFHPGMGALINVTSSTAVRSSPSNVNTGTGHK